MQRKARTVVNPHPELHRVGFKEKFRVYSEFRFKNLYYNIVKMQKKKKKKKKKISTILLLFY